jgi:predicted small metal-binding protein
MKSNAIEIDVRDLENMYSCENEAEEDAMEEIMNRLFEYARKAQQIKAVNLSKALDKIATWIHEPTE